MDRVVNSGYFRDVNHLRGSTSRSTSTSSIIDDTSPTRNTKAFKKVNNLIPNTYFLSERYQNSGMYSTAFVVREFISLGFLITQLIL